MATGDKSVMGRPRSAPVWDSKMNYRLTVAVQNDRDVHTALFEAGEKSSEFLIACVRHYLKAISSPCLDTDYQNQVIAKALSIPPPDAGSASAE